LATSWISIDPKLRLSKENPDSVDKQFLAVFMDMAGLKGRNTRIYLEENLVLSIFNQLFPESFPEIERMFQQQCGIEKKKLLTTDSDLQNSVNNDVAHEMLMDQSLSTEQEIVYPAAYLTISIRQKFAQELARLQSQSIEELKVDIVKMASENFVRK
jgi:hypothetical protein